MNRRTIAWTAAALLGIVATAAVAWTASRLAAQRIGLSAEPPSVANGLAPGRPPVARPRASRRPRGPASANGGGAAAQTRPAPAPAPTAPGAPPTGSTGPAATSTAPPPAPITTQAAPGSSTPSAQAGHATHRDDSGGGSGDSGGHRDD